VTRPHIYARSVFINCPFSLDYQPIFRAILFAVYACRYQPRCAFEISDSSQNRLGKILDIIRASKYSIHDISFMSLDPKTKLARLNMSFELGLFFASKSFGSGEHKRKVALIFDRSGYRYQKALSDISGQDISLHQGSPKIAIRKVRNWLDTCQGGSYSLPGGEHIGKQYTRYSKQLPSQSAAIRLNANRLTYADTCRSIESWLAKDLKLAVVTATPEDK
jgi:hypothetical protein